MIGKPYCLEVLQLEENRIKKKSDDMKALKTVGQKINERELTKCTHQLQSLTYAIELLEDHFGIDA